MIDPPSGDEILDAVARLLRDTLMPALPPDLVFQARVAANAVDLVAREMRHGPQARLQSQQRLASLLGREGELADLETELAARIREGAIAPDHAQLFEHLMADAMARMAIEQPGYAAYRDELARQAGTADAREPER